MLTPAFGRTVYHLANSCLTRASVGDSVRSPTISRFGQRTRRCFAHTSIATNRGLKTEWHRSHFLRNEGGRSCKIHLVGYCEGGENCLAFFQLTLFIYISTLCIFKITQRQHRTRIFVNPTYQPSCLLAFWFTSTGHATSPALVGNGSR